MKKTQEIFVHLNKYDQDGYILNQFDMSSCGYVLVNKQIVEFEVPDDFDPVPVQVVMLRAEEAKVRKDFNERIAQIKEELSKLQCLEFSGVVPV